MKIMLDFIKQRYYYADMKDEKKKKIDTYCGFKTTRAQHDKAMKFARSQERSFSWLCRTAVSQYLERQAQ